MTHIEIQQERSASCIALCMHVRMLTPGCPFSVDNSCGYAKADHDEAAAAGRASQFQDVRKGGIFEDEQDGEESSATSQLVAAYQVSIPGLRRNHEAHYSVRLGPPHSRLGSALAREALKEADKIEWRSRAPMQGKSTRTLPSFLTDAIICMNCFMVGTA
jgi:hypothetical protein